MLAKIGKRWEMRLFDLGTSQTFTPGVQYSMLIKVLAGTASPQVAPIGAAASKSSGRAQTSICNPCCGHSHLDHVQSFLPEFYQASD